MSMRMCLHPGCRTLVVGGSRCSDHTETQAQRQARGLTGKRGSSYAWRKLRRLVFRQQGDRCVYCGAVATCVDHVVAKANGGRDTPENLVPACAACNARKGAK